MVDTRQKSALPTRKWIAARVTAIAGVLILWVNADAWNDEATIAVITLVAEAIVSYLVPNQGNEEAIGGVPVKT